MEISPYFPTLKNGTLCYNDDYTFALVGNVRETKGWYNFIPVKYFYCFNEIQTSDFHPDEEIKTIRIDCTNQDDKHNEGSLKEIMEKDECRILYIRGYLQGNEILENINNNTKYPYQISVIEFFNNSEIVDNSQDPLENEKIIRRLFKAANESSVNDYIEEMIKKALLEKAYELDPILQYQIDYDKGLREDYENYNFISDPKNGYHDDIKALLDLASNPLIANKISESTREYEERYGNKKDDNKYIDAANYFKDNFKPQKISDIIDEIQQKRQNYSCDFIKNVLICIAQNFITVFAGQPGTGKTSLCDIIAGTLGLDKLRYDALDISRYISVSVERGWNSKSELIGYYNALSKEYEDSGNGLYHALKLLDKEKADAAFPFFVLLDEANLSPVEHYWSAFMKLADDSQLYDEDIRGEITIGGGEKLKVPDQLRFLATVNNDLTTEPLSPRLLDRTSVIKLPEVDFNGSVSESQIAGKAVSWSDFKAAFLPENGKKLSELSLKVGDEDITLEEFLKGVYSIFKEAKMPVSIRIQNRIAQYIASAVALSMHENIAVDYAVAQNLLPKINGYYEDYADFISKLSGFVEYTAYKNKALGVKRFPLLYDTLEAFGEAAANNEYISYLSL